MNRRLIAKLNGEVAVDLSIRVLDDTVVYDRLIASIAHQNVNQQANGCAELIANIANLAAGISLVLIYDIYTVAILQLIRVESQSLAGGFYLELALSGGCSRLKLLTLRTILVYLPCKQNLRTRNTNRNMGQGSNIRLNLNSLKMRNDDLLTVSSLNNVCTSLSSQSAATNISVVASKSRSLVAIQCSQLHALLTGHVNSIICVLHRAILDLVKHQHQLAGSLIYRYDRINRVNNQFLKIHSNLLCLNLVSISEPI